MEIDLLNFNERALPELQKLTKETWDLYAALSSAETLKYTRAIKILVSQEIAEPSDALVRHYACQCYNGKIMPRVLEAFRPIVKRAYSEYISDQISKRLETVRKAEEQVSITQYRCSSVRLRASGCRLRSGLPPPLRRKGLRDYSVWK